MAFNQSKAKEFLIDVYLVKLYIKEIDIIYLFLFVWFYEQQKTKMTEKRESFWPYSNEHTLIHNLYRLSIIKMVFFRIFEEVFSRNFECKIPCFNKAFQ